MDFEETEEQRLLRESVRRIASSFGHRWYVERARAGEKTKPLWEALAKEGFLGVSIPEAYGGGGLGISELCIVCEELSTAGCPLLLLVVSPAICGTVIARFGDDAQRQRWLPGLASGATTMCFALTEPDAGSNSHQVSTTAVKDGDSWRISGQKYYISGVDEAEQMLLVTRTGTDERTGRGQLSLFIVDTDTPGLRRDPIAMELVSPEKQFTLFFDDVRVPADRLIGGEGQGLKALFFGLNPERITSAAYCVGLARYALEKGSSYARDRKVWGGTPIGAHQGIAHPLAKAFVQTELAKLMTQKAAWLHDHGKDAGEASNMARLSSADAAIDALDAAIQTHGGNGLASEYGLADLWGFARLQRIAPVSREMILNFVAQHSLGLPKSY
ncbi:MAG: acyl-CoA/acyl-ACP dehydrogenase [Myxococcota bacterium]|nr:acyl-CoA/acyl-ACP dehydrogenase [Myxococcota bacterium]